MFFGMFYIKNYHANYNSYFPLKVKGLIGKNICIHAHRDCLWNPITQRKSIIPNLT